MCLLVSVLIILTRCHVSSETGNTLEFIDNHINTFRKSSISMGDKNIIRTKGELLPFAADTNTDTKSHTHIHTSSTPLDVAIKLCDKNTNKKRFGDIKFFI